MQASLTFTPFFRPVGSLSRLEGSNLMNGEETSVRSDSSAINEDTSANANSKRQSNQLQNGGARDAEAEDDDDDDDEEDEDDEDEDDEDEDEEEDDEEDDDEDDEEDESEYITRRSAVNPQK